MKNGDMNMYAQNVGEKIIDMTSDESIICDIAESWLECGGDSEGFLYNWNKLYEKIKELENVR